MLRFAWTALRSGDRVLVHDDYAAGSTLLRGVVAMVDRAPGGKDIGIRTTEVDGTTRVRRPRRLAVHLDPHDATEECWQCVRLTEGADRVGA